MASHSHTHTTSTKCSENREIAINEYTKDVFRVGDTAYVADGWFPNGRPRPWVQVTVLAIQDQHPTNWNGFRLVFIRSQDGAKTWCDTNEIWVGSNSLYASVPEND